MTITEAFEALMPEPVGYVPFPGEFYPPDELDAEVKDDPFTTRVYSHAQMRAMFDAATERAAKQEREECAKLCDQQAADHTDFKNTEAAIGCDGHAAAIRARDEGVRG